MLHATSSLLNAQSIPFFLLDGSVGCASSSIEQLFAAVLLGMPFPWAESIEGYILAPDPNWSLHEHTPR